MKVKIGDLTKIKTGKLDANASSEDGQYPFFTCSKEPLKISTYSYDCECVLVAGNGDLNVKYYNGKFDAYQRTYIIENNSDGKLYMPYLYLFMEEYVEELRRQAIGGVIKYIKLGNLTDAMNRYITSTIISFLLCFYPYFYFCYLCRKKYGCKIQKYNWINYSNRDWNNWHFLFFSSVCRRGYPHVG